MARVPYRSTTMTARRTQRTRLLDLAAPEDARYFAAHHLANCTPATLRAVLGVIESDPRPHTLPQSTDDLARNIRERLALMEKYKAH